MNENQQGMSLALVDFYCPLPSCINTIDMAQYISKMKESYLKMKLFNGEYSTVFEVYDLDETRSIAIQCVFVNESKGDHIRVTFIEVYNIDKIPDSVLDLINELNELKE